MDKRFVFNNNFMIYDKIRPEYPEELYRDIFEYIEDISSPTKALEIGIGTGQATKPFLDNSFDVTAIDIGENFVCYLNEKFGSYSNFRALCGDFIQTDFSCANYDLIYSATAFHWLPDEKYKKVKSLLKHSGTIALFWNHPFVRCSDDETNVRNAEIYDKYYGKSDSIKIKQFEEADTLKIKNELTENGFDNVVVKLYKRVRTLSSEEYINLLNTYSDHGSLPKEIRLSFEKDMLTALSSCGNKINIYDTIDLYLGKK